MSTDQIWIFSRPVSKYKMFLFFSCSSLPSLPSGKAGCSHKVLAPSRSSCVSVEWEGRTTRGRCGKVFLATVSHVAVTYCDEGGQEGCKKRREGWIGSLRGGLSEGVAGWSPVEFYMKLSIRNSVTAFSPALPGKPVASSMVISPRMGVIFFFSLDSS